MGKINERKLTAQQLRNLQIVEDRLELLDIIRDLIDLELDRRGIPSEVIDHPGKLPPRRRGGKPSEAMSSAGSSFWQRGVNIVRMSDGLHARWCAGSNAAVVWRSRETRQHIPVLSYSQPPSASA